jgi:transcriptional regulator with XRE-family HTH domain
VTTVGDHLRKRRMDLEIGRRELAKRLGVSKRTIENWEGDETAPVRWMLPRIDEFLGRRPSEITPSIAGNLTFFRQRLGLSQADLARSLGVHRCTVVRWKTGRRRPNKSFLRNIDAFLTEANFKDSV